MADAEANKEAVMGLLQTAFLEGKPEEGVARYMGSRYTQHNPQAPDGPDGFIGYVNGFKAQFPEMSYDVKRVIAEGDLVVLHGHMKMSPDDRGSAVVDIFRLEDGKIVEHWDVLQPVPETAVNDNTMF